jgi:putative ATP-dependent endonuclease of the OLD family
MVIVELLSVEISGYRSLADVVGLPVSQPTILTGHNDSGRSAVLTAIGWLLNRGHINDSDYTFVRKANDDSERDEGRADQCVKVVGIFRANKSEQDALDVQDTVKVRRRVSPNTAPVHEILRQVPEDPQLRGLAEIRLADLKALCHDFGISPVGPGTRRDSWYEPLRAYADSCDQVEEWDSAPRNLIAALPDFLLFYSTAEPDPRAEAQEALSASFDRHIADPELAGQMKKVELQLTERLTADAEKLRDHIRSRCPGLNDVVVQPRVSMRQGFTGVDLKASRITGEDVDLHSSGAGRRRLVTLAIWEWVKELLREGKNGDEKETDKSLVVAYDEPDTHLDYSHQRELMDLFRAQCEVDGVRMIVATHSLNLIDRVDISSVAHLRLVDERTTLERLLSNEDEAVERYLADVSIAMGLRNSTLLHERCFVICEGATEQQAFPPLFRLAQGLPMQSMGVALIPAEGNEGALKIGGHLKKRQRRVALVLDSDTAKNDSTKRMFRPDRLRGVGFNVETDVHYIGENELEDLFSDEQWAEAGNKHWPRNDSQPWTASHIRALRVDGKFSDKLLALFRDNSELGPGGKTELVPSLARDLCNPDQIPKQLREVFAALVQLATGDE